MKILYVEDNPVDADLARRMLARAMPDACLEVAPDVAAARARLSGEVDFDLVLCDLSLPDGSGMEVLSHVRAQDLPLAVVILTGLGDQEAVVAALKAGADDYLGKHGDYLEHLPSTLLAALERYRSAASRRARPLRVLYVEHNAFDIDLTRRHFTQYAPYLSLDVVENPEQALERLPRGAGETYSHDVLLLDYRLPGIDALELTRILRQERGLDIPVVLVTGQGSEEIAARALHLGVSDYLTKHAGYLFELPSTLEKACHQVGLARERAALKASQQRYEELVAHIPAGVFRLRTTPDGGQHFEYVSPRFCENLGIVAAAALADAGTVFGALHPDDLPGFLAGIERGCHDRQPCQWSGRAVVAGQIRWMRIDATPEARENGEIVWDGVQIDITLRKQAEARLQLLGTALEAAANAIMITDDQGVIQWANPAFFALTGYDLNEAVGRRPGDLVRSGLQSGEFYRVLWQTIRSGRVWRGELINRRKDGTLYDVDETITPVPDEDGVIRHFVAIKQDITGRKRAEDKLRQAAMVFENTRDGVLITDAAPTILAVNRAFSEITGYAEEEVLGRNPNLLRSDRHDRPFYQALWASLREAGYWQGEIWNRRKSGEIYPEWLTISAVHGKDGEISQYVSVFTDISRLRRTEEDLSRLTHFDPLTGLPNRLLFQSRLEHALEAAPRHDWKLAVLLLDLDLFKDINDSLGHPAGDELLRKVTGRVQRRMGVDDTLARLGGDEFALLLEHLADPQDAALLAQDVVDLLASPFRLDDGHEVYLGGSIGISLFPNDGETATELMRNADTALYQAKENGRGQFCFYTGSMNADTLARLELETALRGAVERGELVLHYQPKVDLDSGRICGAEALLRWRRDGSLVPPSHFVPVAERTGLIIAIGEWVIDAACRQIRVWQDEHLLDVKVAVNVSARQFRAGNLDAVVPRILEKHGINPSLLELELTESMLMDHPDETIVLLHRLKRIGLKLSLDDFGTGYSSFAYLSRFPIDTLKIDQSFVRDLVTEPASATIAVSIINMAHRMRLRVVAEGVEAEAQLGYLKMNRCDEMQGYYFSRPLPAEEFAALLREGRALPRAPEENAPPRTLLLVDDEPNVISALRRVLRREGYRILSAGSAREGLEVLAREPVQVILSDQRMPEMSGAEFLSRVKDIHPDTVRIVLSGYTELESIIRAVNEGAIYKFLTKPWDEELLRAHIQEAFRFHEAILRPRGGDALRE